MVTFILASLVVLAFFVPKLIAQRREIAQERYRTQPVEQPQPAEAATAAQVQQTAAPVKASYQPKPKRNWNFPWKTLLILLGLGGGGYWGWFIYPETDLNLNRSIKIFIEDWETRIGLSEHSTPLSERGLSFKAYSLYSQPIGNDKAQPLREGTVIFTNRGIYQDMTLKDLSDKSCKTFFQGRLQDQNQWLSWSRPMLCTSSRKCTSGQWKWNDDARLDEFYSGDRRMKGVYTCGSKSNARDVDKFVFWLE